MTDRLKEIPAKLLEWWNKYTSKQKTIIISIAATVLVALVILVTVLTRTQYELLVTCDSTKEAAEIADLLDSASPAIEYKASDDGFQIYVEKGRVSEASLLMGANNIPTDAMSITDVTSGGLSTTESDKQKLYKAYKEEMMEKDLKSLENITSVNVQLNIPENNGTMIAQEEDSSAAIMLELSDALTNDQITGIAQYVKTALGNENIQTITIIDNEGNLLFSGDDTQSASGSASSQLTVKQQTEAILESNIKKVLLGTNEYNLVEVSSNLQLDFSSTEITEHLYEPADGSSQGVLSHEDTYESESTGGVSGTPGTDSNDGDEYVLQDYENSSSSTSEISRDYLPNETITLKQIPAGLIDYDQSSLSVAAIKYNVLKEEDAKNQGLLDGITWDEYKAQNTERTKLEIDEDIIDIVAKASGISSENISVIAYEEPMYIDAEGLSVSVTDILQIVLIVVILALLAFVIIRSMRGEKETEEEEEVSIETLLQSTPEAELEDISLENKSETRKLVEKFVDENPEAAANLLRNWLNEDWG